MTKPRNKNDKPKSMDISDLVKKVLAEQIGVEPTDIGLKDSFYDDLHMSAADLSDLINMLTKKGVDVSKIDITQIKTVHDLVESLSSEELIE